MTVHQPGQADLTRQVKDRVGLLGQLPGRPDLADPAVLRVQGSVAQFPALPIDADQDVGVAGKARTCGVWK